MERRIIFFNKEKKAMRGKDNAVIGGEITFISTFFFVAVKSDFICCLSPVSYFWPEI